MTDKFCVLPFVHAVYNPYDPEVEKSNISICCRIDQTTNDFSGTNEPIKNTELRQKIQQEFLSGNIPDVCYRCVDEERMGGKSYRVGMNDLFNSMFSTDEILEKKLRFLEIVPGNTCNLACRMCNNVYSSKRDKFDRFLSDNNFSNYSKRSFQDWRNLNLEDLRVLKLMGGEPTHLREHISLLIHLRELGILHNIDLQMPTNATIRMTDEWKNILLECNSVTLAVSIDGIGSLNEYIRQYSDWNIILENLRDLVEFSTRSENTLVSFNTVITCLNVNKSKETEVFLQENFPEMWAYQDVTPYPDYLSVRYLPSSLRKKLLNMDSISDIVRKFLITLPESNKNLVPRCMEFINLSDQFYGTSFESVNPEMYNLLMEHMTND